jgi:hypothetical protein
LSSLSRPISLVAERAVRLLRREGRPIGSRRLAREVLATTTPNEAAARKVLETAFASDRRLICDGGQWTLRAPDVSPSPPPSLEFEPDRALILVHGERPGPGRPYALRNISVLRLQDDDVQSACGGDTTPGAYGDRLRRGVLKAIDGAVPVVHDPPGALRALEHWLGEPLAAPVSLRRLGQERVGLPASHSLEDLVGRLGLPWRDTDDPLEQADLLDSCLQALRRPGETLQELRVHSSGVQPIDWSRFAFNREFLRRIPSTPGTYRFYDIDGRLVYVGKSNNLQRRVNSYFREEGRRRSQRVQRLLDSVYRIEYEASGSDLEAVLREAEMIRRERPEQNVQRRTHPRRGRAAWLDSILILEPAAPPSVLRACLIRSGRLVCRVNIGPRGGGLSRIRRILDDCFFSAPEGPTVVQGPDLDVELVVRWLASNRDRVVAFDPTDLRSSEEVVERLRWFLERGGPFDPDGTPIVRL